LFVKITPGPLIAVLFAGVLCACAAVEDTPTEPTFYRSMASAAARLDANAAASMISGYRRNSGLGAVTLDPALMRAAEVQAQAMARSKKFEHNAGGEFKSRIAQSGFDADVAVENIGAGYHTLAEAFSGWRDSPQHRANMLKAGVTHMGIATAYAPGSKYKVFWALIMAGADENANKGVARLPTMGSPEPAGRRVRKASQ
jgi:uncharacterized protein YkwD